MTISIIHDAQDWMVVSKPAGISVHNPEDAANVLSVLRSQTGQDWNPVHRIDKPTSGLLVLARRPDVTHLLQHALGTAKKTYVAIVRGQIQNDSGEWMQPLTNKAEGARNPQGKKAQRVHAHTQYTRCDGNQHLTALRIQILTGRQHQIRKHAAINRHAVLGDPRYGDRRYNKMIRERYAFEGMTLHAEQLQLELDGVSYHWQDSIPSIWSCFPLGFKS